MPVIAQRKDIKITDTKILTVCGYPLFRIVDGAIEIVDDNRLRSQARGGKAIMVQFSDIIRAMQQATQL